MLRMSDFIAATYALSLVLANFGIAIAARMPMMTTTIRSSMRVKPFLLFFMFDRSGFGESRWPPTASRRLSGSIGGTECPTFSRHISLASTRDFFEHALQSDDAEFDSLQQRESERNFPVV